MSVARWPDVSPVRVGLVVLGIAILAVATTTGGLGPLEGAVTALVDLAGHDYVVAAVLGALAVVVGVLVLFSGREANMDQTEMPVVERPVPVASAGEGFDETIGSTRFGLPILGRSSRAEVRDRLRAIATAVVATDGRSRREARRRVANGTWTDDSVAAGFLAGRRATVGTWLAAVAGGEMGPKYRARRTVAAIRERRRSASDRASTNGGGGGRSPNGEAPGEHGRNATSGSGVESNGPSPHDTTSNSTSSHGPAPNSTSSHGTASNGTSTNGRATNGSGPTDRGTEAGGGNR